MNSITFDTYAYIKKLKDKGISEQQAEAFVDMVKDAQKTDISHLATKEELNTFTSELKADIAALESRLKVDNIKIIMWVVSMSFAQAAMILSVLNRCTNYVWLTPVTFPRTLSIYPLCVAGTILQVNV